MPSAQRELAERIVAEVLGLDKLRCSTIAMQHSVEGMLSAAVKPLADAAQDAIHPGCECDACCLLRDELAKWGPA